MYGRKSEVAQKNVCMDLNAHISIPKELTSLTTNTNLVHGQVVAKLGKAQPQPSDSQDPHLTSVRSSKLSTTPRHIS